MENREIDLLDCYRIALDFGLPAAEKAITLVYESSSKSVRSAPLTQRVIELDSQHKIKHPNLATSIPA